MGLPKAPESGLLETEGAISQIIWAYPEFDGQIPGILMYRLPEDAGTIAVEGARGRLMTLFFTRKSENRTIKLRENVSDGPFLSVFNPDNFKSSIELDGKNCPLAKVVIDGKIIDINSPDDSPEGR
ncbi:MAG: hypothetical protein OEY44_00590 [Candidatus Peregrinibacteria bacterium]|nr:hypothetical protein [Candidatus Peregrinibacteria bacterium]